MHVRTLILGGNVSPRSRLPPDFHYFPDFFSIPEQRVLLAAALQKLDTAESRQFRRLRKVFLAAQTNSPVAGDRHSPDHTVQAMFLPDECYNFEEGHYDGVIRRFREMHVTSWPSDINGLLPALERLQQLCLTKDTQTHILHLATDGEILPHVDNIGASGSWIMGVSLGSARIMRLESTEARDIGAFEIPLTSGSVYIQKCAVSVERGDRRTHFMDRDSTRYGYQHSILKDSVLDGKHYSGGQRLSVMIRDLLPTAHTQS
ncbi:predicted protein [Postia placenta Mad-698-R]|nr:predicted protein [Postia placenta Mad-698-R]